MSGLDIARLRLHNQHISQAKFELSGDEVSWLCAVQAQDYAGAKWSLGLRLRGASDRDIERAFNDGAILRTHLMRPTWHFVTPADIRWLLALTAPRVHAANAYMVRRLELDNAIFNRSNETLAKALQGGKQLTRDELREMLEQAGIPTKGDLRMSYFMMHAELDGVVCSGARRGKQFTYALLDDRAPQARELAREDALAELSKHYFLSRGPATVQDFAKWSGLTIADARQGLEMVKDLLQEQIVDGRPYWFSPSAPPASGGSPSAYLLSIYDEYISGYKDRSAIAREDIGAKLIELGNALSYIIVVDGQIVGVWKRTLRKDAVVIEADLFTSLGEAERQAVAVAADKYGEFLGLPVVLFM
jgi:hypothetical protein